MNRTRPKTIFKAIGTKGNVLFARYVHDLRELYKEVLNHGMLSQVDRIEYKGKSISIKDIYMGVRNDKQ